MAAGLAAGLIAAAFHFVMTEPVIDRAIALEEAFSPAGEGAEAPIVERDVQRGGLVLGFLLYGLAWALVFGVVYHLVQDRLPASSAQKRGALLALLAYWAVGLLPFLKYPASPPGVGDPETIGYRQGLYLGFLALSIGGAALALVLGRRLNQLMRARSGPWLPSLTLLVLVASVLVLAMPANPDAVAMPPDLVQRFRVLSLAGITLFWGVLGLGFGWIVRPKPSANAPDAAT